MTIDPREFRNTVGCFATGVTVITTIDVDEVPIGLTANSFTSVSLEPPMVLFCLDRKVTSFDSFAVGKPFVINILAVDQIDVSNRFGRLVGQGELTTPIQTVSTEIISTSFEDVIDEVHVLAVLE